MAYEPEKDKTFHEHILEVDGQRIRAGVYSYADGEKKIGFTRIVRKQDGIDKIVPIGRLRKAEAKGIRDELDKLLDLMEDPNP